MSIPSNIKNVLILRCGALGDLIYATSVIDALHMQYGEDIIIDFITTPGTAKLFECDSRVNRIFPLKHKKLPVWISPQKRDIIRHSKKHPYDLAILLDADHNFKNLIKKISATFKTGIGFLENHLPKTLNRGEWLKNFYSNIVDSNILSKAKPILSGVAQNKLLNKFDLQSQYLVIAPSNSHNKRKGINYRAWPNDYWRSLIHTLSAQTTVIIVGARGEDTFFNALKPYPQNNIIDLVGKLSIAELITTVKNAKALICTDSATGHIGAAVDTPTFVLMGPNNPITDSPYQSNTNYVYPISLSLSCSPCYKTEAMKHCKENICMSKITPEMVLESLKLANVL